jgi:hypothetical protein
VLRKPFGSKKEILQQETGENCIMRSVMICTSSPNIIKEIKSTG